MNRSAPLLVGLLACLPCTGVRAEPAAPEAPITVEVVPAATYAVRHHTGAYAELAADYPRILAWMRAGGLAVGGPAEGLYEDDPLNIAAARLRSRAAFPVAEPLPEVLPSAADGVLLVRAPARLVARTVHRGPYAQVRPAYDRLQRALPSLGLRYVGPMREVYRNDPAVTAAGELCTEVCLLVEPSAKTDVGLYAGPGAEGQGLRSLSQALFAAGLSLRPLEAAAFRDGSFRKACRAVLVPGGWAPQVNAALGEGGLKQLSEFVRGGGGYVGVCAGAYLATAQVVWEGESLAYPLGLLAGSATGPLTSVAPWPERALTGLTLEGSHPILGARTGRRTVLYQGGPVLAPARDGVSVLARFEAGGGAALVAFLAGEGRVVLSSVHLEGLPSDDAAAPTSAPGPAEADPEPDRDLLTRALLWVLRKDLPRPR